MKVMNYVGENIDTVKQQLTNANIRFITQEKPSDKDKGIVTDQDPKEGEYLPPGGTLMLTVSSGKQQVSVPDLSGKNYLDAEKILKNNGLDYGNERYEDSDQPQGTVVRQDPAANTMADVGFKVDFWIARPKGSTAMKMPDVYGLSQDVAKDRITARGVDSSKIKVVQRASNVATGFVDGQAPDANTDIDNTTQVTIYVSNGVLPGYIKVYVPDLEITSDNTEVKIVLIDDNNTTTTFFDRTYNAGTYNPAVTLQSMTLGDKTLKIYYNNKEVHKETITFTAGDAASTSAP
jgi:serine/threonine-protein kinase